MKYQEQILSAFSRLGFKPRDGQIFAVNSVLEAFLDEKMQNVILNAPTGAGKSLIGAVAAEALSDIRSKSVKGPKSSISLTASNVLSKQYGATFSALTSENDSLYTMLKGAGNYDCTALTTEEEAVNAEACAWFTMVQAGSEFEHVMAEHCNKCEFLKVKRKKNTSRHLTTNYSYFFIDRMYTGKFENRDLVVWDEAHLVNDLFSEHNAIHFSQKRIQQYQKEIAETVRLTDLEISKILSSIASDCAKPGKINENNYTSYLNAILKVYRYAKEQGTIQGERALRSGQMNQYTKLSRFTKKYEGLACKIDDLYKYDYPHVFEYKEDEMAVSVKPVFVGMMMDALQCSDFNLFMSATVSPDFMKKTLNLAEDKTKFIKLDPTFPVENKEIVFFDTLSLSYASLQVPETVKQLRKNVAKIVKHHVAEGQRGIILTPSFKLQSEIVNELKAQPNFKNYKLFEHVQGTKLEHTLDQFTTYWGGPAVLISPSMFEGVDLGHDLSRFQILVKAPYPSLADKRIKWILDNHKEIYELLATMKLVQGAGRSVRSADDHAVTYILDKNAERLFNSKQNIWRNEFTVRFTKFL